MPDIKDRDNIVKKARRITHTLKSILFTVLLMMAASTVASAQSDTEDAKCFEDFLDLKEGSVVAEIGAGDDLKMMFYD